MLMDRLMADPSFITGPSTELITDDVYDKQDDSLVNALPKFAAIDLSAADKIVAADLKGGLGKSIMGGIPVSLGNIKTLMASSQSGLQIGGTAGLLKDAGSMIKSGYNMVGGLSGIKTLISVAKSPDLLKSMAGNYVAGMPGMPAIVSQNIGPLLRAGPAGLKTALQQTALSGAVSFISGTGVAAKIPYEQVNDAIGIARTISSFTGKELPGTFLDKPGTSAFISALATEGIRSGLPNSFSAASELAGTGNPDIINKAAVPVLEQIKNIGSIQALQDVCSTIGSKAMQAISPNAIAGVAENFRLPAGAIPADVATEWDKATQTFKAINPNWDKSTRTVVDPSLPDGVKELKVTNLTVFQEGSEDFKRMMANGVRNSDTPGDKFKLLGNVFASDSVSNSLSKLFPEAAQPGDENVVQTKTSKQTPVSKTPLGATTEKTTEPYVMDIWTLSRLTTIE